MWNPLVSNVESGRDIEILLPFFVWKYLVTKSNYVAFEKWDLEIFQVIIWLSALEYSIERARSGGRERLNFV